MLDVGEQQSSADLTALSIAWNKNKIRELFKVKLYTIRSETEKRDREKKN